MFLTACQAPSTHNALSSNEKVERIAVTSCTHIGFLDALGQLDKVVAVCNKDLIYTSLPDSVIDLGDALSPNIEVLLRANIDVVFVSSYTQDKVAAKMEQLGLNIIYINEWQESTPLQRTAWIRTFGDVLDCRERADSIYSVVETRYDSLRTCAHAYNKQGVTIMTGNDFRGTWYVPSGNTFMGRLFLDAGAQYAFYADSRTESIPLTLEKAITTFQQADVWVGVNAQSLAELKALDIRHTWMNAYQLRQVYNWSKQSTHAGANNFWERGVVHPDEILEDLIYIVHPSTQTALLHFASRLE